MRRFDQFIAIDWSGAAGERHKGIAMAVTDADGGPPVLVAPPDKGWSRREITDILLHDIPDKTLIGVDLGISLPFADADAFLPGWHGSPDDAKSLWACIDSICSDDPHMGANGFVDHPEIAPYFRRHGGREGEHFGGGRGRLRVTEHAQADMGLKPYSNFNLVGAAQVGKSSLTGMRMLAALQPRMAVWPIDPLPDPLINHGPVLVEIYTSLAAMEAGRSASRAKMRDYAALNDALAALGSPRVAGKGAIDDHSSDALLTAAWLRKVHAEPARWNPSRLTQTIAQTEGWTFGAL